MNDYTYNDVIFVFLRELRRTIIEVQFNRQGTTPDQLKRTYGRIATESGGLIAANRFLLDVIANEDESITVRGFSAEIVASASEYIEAMAYEFKERLKELYQKENVPFIQIALAYSFSRWGDSGLALKLLNEMKSNIYKSNPEALTEIERRLGDLGGNANFNYLKDESFIRDSLFNSDKSFSVNTVLNIAKTETYLLKSGKFFILSPPLDKDKSNEMIVINTPPHREGKKSQRNDLCLMKIPIGWSYSKQ